jgi:hypothetical protein
VLHVILDKGVAEVTTNQALCVKHCGQANGRAIGMRSSMSAGGSPAGG